MGAVKWPTRGKKARGGVFVWWGGCEGVGGGGAVSLGES